MNDFYQNAVAKVKESMHGYWLDKKIDYILNACEDKQVYLIGVTNPNWTGTYLLEGETYDVVPIDEQRCIISSRLALKMNNDSKEILVDASVSCVNKNGKVFFFYVHMTRIDSDKLVLKDAFRNSDQNSDDKYRAVIHGVYDVVIEYSCLNNTFKYDHKEYRELFKMDKYYITIDQWFWSFVSECVHPDDSVCLDVFRDSDMTKRIQKHQNVIETEFRVRNDKKDYIWVKMYIIIIPNETSTNVKEMYMLFKDIDNEKTEAIDNKVLARTDDITSVWNKTYSEELINMYMNKEEESGVSAIVLLDVDDLHVINDTYGRMTGDYILNKIAGTILNAKQPEDILGRFHADCFIFYINSRKDIDGVKSMIEKISKISNFEYEENGKKSNICCSIGAVIINDQKNFEYLCGECEKALEEARNTVSHSYLVE